MLYKKTIITLVAISSFIIFQGFFFNTGEDTLEAIKKQFHTNLDHLDVALSMYEQAAATTGKSAADRNNLRKAHTETRLAFKSIEFLIDYIDPLAVKRNFNGSPLPTTEPSVPELAVLSPKGLQVLDDLVFSDNPLDEIEQIRSLLAQLRADLEQSKSVWLGTPLTHRNIFEAARREMIRIFSLGVTGFDTPGSANALPEAAAAFDAVHAAMQAYLPMLEAKERGLAILFDARLEHTKSFLHQNHDFEQFDRLQFLTEHINPLYELIYRVHRKLEIETIEETDVRPQPVNYHAVNIFDPALLNVGFYAKIKMNVPGSEKRQSLGRLLFFDPVLSENLSVSCSSCHHPEKAFTDGRTKSLSNDGHKTLQRNAPTLLNCVFSESYFLDLREPDLDRQILHVVKNQNEFNTDYIEMMRRIKLSTGYVNLFRDAYPEVAREPVTPYTISNALASYVAGLISFDSPFDRYVTGKTGVIAPKVVQGFNLFMGKAACGTCHFAPVFNGTTPPVFLETESEVIGVPADPHATQLEVDNDEGRFANLKPRDHAPFYRYAFKTPTVRNIARTAPYMHNGCYQTLEEVVDFYNKGGGQGLGIHLPHQTLPFSNLHLTKAEEQAIIAFMESLSDTNTIYTAPDSLPQFDQKPEWNNRYQATSYKR